MDGFNPAEPNIVYPQQNQNQNQNRWPPHLLPSAQSSSFPSPVSPPSSDYSPYYQQQQQQQQQQQPDGMHSAERATLSLNLSSLSVTSPANLSPINPQPNHPTSALSPITPISPASSLQNSHPFAPHHHIQNQFQFTPPDQQQPNQTQSQSQNSQNHVTHYDDHHQSHYERRLATPTTSRSSSSSTSSASISLPRKRSFTSNASSHNGTLVEEAIYDDASMDLAPSYDDMSAYGAAPSLSAASTAGGRASPVDGSDAGGDEMLCGITNPSAIGIGVGGTINILGKPMATNNFVTKLYQMINDPKSQHFIAWTELGTSFVVSNVGEFSRSILGSHFKHNNFSSFVRQLNMYGFHKINRTPRAQRTSTDAQTWEFSHHKFLRGRPDLLDEIKRKALEPDPAVKHRVELPGEVAAQLGAMRDENRRVWEQLAAERRRVEKLTGVVARLYDVVGKGFPGSVPPFPSDLFDNGADSPNIYITSPPSSTSSPSRFPPPLSMRISSQSLGSLHSLSSPNSSPTMADADFPIQNLHHTHDHHRQHHHPHPSLSRQHSFQHVSFSRSDGAGSTPLPSSPGSVTMDLFDDSNGDSPIGRGSIKRQRTSNGSDTGGGGGGGGGDEGGIVQNGVVGSGGPPVSVSGKRLARARSDSAPLGYVLGGLNAPWNAATRPRSGSGIAGTRTMGMIGVQGMARSATVSCVGGPQQAQQQQQQTQSQPPMVSLSGAGNASGR